MTPPLRVLTLEEWMAEETARARKRRRKLVGLGLFVLAFVAGFAWEVLR